MSLRGEGIRSPSLSATSCWGARPIRAAFEAYFHVPDQSRGKKPLTNPSIRTPPSTGRGHRQTLQHRDPLRQTLAGGRQAQDRLASVMHQSPCSSHMDTSSRRRMSVARVHRSGSLTDCFRQRRPRTRMTSRSGWRRSPRWRLQGIAKSGVPAYHVGGWFDGFCRSTLPERKRREGVDLHHGTACLRN